LTRAAGLAHDAAVLRSIASLYRGAFSGLSRRVWLLAAATLVNRSGTMVLPFLALYLTADRGFSITDAGRALAAWGIGGIAGSYLGGWLSDRTSALAVMRATLLGTAGGFLLLSQVEGRTAILATILAVSTVGEAFRPASAAAIGLASGPAERIRSFSLYRLAINLGMSLGPALGGLLAAYSYRWLFLADAATCALAAGLLWLFFPHGMPRAAAPAPGAPPERSPWRDPPFLALMLLVFVFAAVLFQLMTTYPLMLRDHYGMTEARIGLVLGINAFCIALFEMVLVHSLGRSDPVRLMAVGSLVLCLGYGMLPLGSTLGFAIVTVLVWTLGEMLSMPAAAGVVTGRAGERNLGSYMGVYTLAFAAAFVVAPLAGAWVYERLGPRALWFGCAAVGPALFLATYALAPVLRQPAAAPPAAVAAPEASV
jgi:predicted MFS family arabinose efflux permease